MNCTVKKRRKMKIFTTILVVILTIILGRWFITCEGLAFEVLTKLLSMFFIGIFSYGIYKILESFEE